MKNGEKLVMIKKKHWLGVVMKEVKSNAELAVPVSTKKRLIE